MTRTVAASIVAENWRIRRRLPRLTALAFRLGMIGKGTEWRDSQMPTRRVRVLGVYPTAIRFADVHPKTGLMATTYTSGIERFVARYRQQKERE
jgi:hypothetical protein